MRHLNAGRSFGRETGHRESMFRNMVTSLMLQGRIRTTEAKAKELRGIAERVITLGKRTAPSTLEGLDGDALARAKARRLHHIRRARFWLRDRKALERVFGEYAERYRTRPGGYTRIYKLGSRGGDNAKMALIELVDHVEAKAETAPADEKKKQVKQAEGGDEAAPAEKPKRTRKKAAAG